MAQRTQSAKVFYDAERKLNEQSRRIMAEVKTAAAIEAKVVEAPTMTQAEAVALFHALEAEAELTSCIERSDVVAAIGTAKVLLASLDCQYHTARWGLGMNGR